MRKGAVPGPAGSTPCHGPEEGRHESLPILTGQENRNPQGEAGRKAALWETCRPPSIPCPTLALAQMHKPAPCGGILTKDSQVTRWEG